MKSRIGRMVACAVLAGMLPAAAHAQSPMQWGVKGGLNLSSLRGSSDLFDSKSGAALGAFAVYDLTPEFGVETDLLFTMKGAKAGSQGVDVNGNPIGIVDAFYILDYLEVPLLARYNVPAHGEVRPHFYLGPTLAFKISSRVEYSQLPEANLDAAKSLDSGLAMGVSADFLMGARKMVIDGRYNLGLTNAFSWDGPDLKNDVFSILAGLTF